MAGDLIEYADPVLTDTGDLGLDLQALNGMMTFEGEIGAALIGPSSSGSSGSDASPTPAPAVVKAAALGGLSLNPLLILALIVIVVIMMDER